jgi:K+-sensing histidine kinase KdpD
MAAVIGAARTLEERWRELNVGQRQSFLALIHDETSRLANLVADVLDTSRFEAGTFTFTFRDVDLTQLPRDVAAAADLAQDEVRVRTEVSGTLPRVRGDRERLRQVIQNLVDHAVKYSTAGSEVRVRASAYDGRIRVDVQNTGPAAAVRPGFRRGRADERRRARRRAHWRASRRPCASPRAPARPRYPAARGSPRGASRGCRPASPQRRCRP